MIPVVMIQNQTECFTVGIGAIEKRSHGNKPEYIVTDGLSAYHKAINKEFHTMRKETVHISNTGIRGKYYKKAKFYNNDVERLNGTIRERNKTQRGLEKEDSVFIKGNNVYYNFIRNHMSLDNITPAEKSGVDLKLGDRKWEKLLIRAIMHQKENNI